MIVDCHVHLFPERLGSAVRRFFDANIDAELLYPLNHREVLDRHLVDGITTVWNLPYAHKRGMAAELNRSMLGVSVGLSDHEVDVIPGCTVHPDDPDPAGDLAAAFEGGARVLKLHCSVGGFDLDDPRLAPVLGVAGELGVPIVVHAGKAMNGSTAHGDLATIGAAASLHPRTTVILAHFGHHAFEHGVELLARHTNLWADLTPVVDDPVPLTRQIAERFADRLLFGTDAPNAGVSARTLLAQLRELGLANSTQDAILHTNAADLVSSGNQPRA